jgi:DNA-binding SARP family transcriptional activator/tetratricopeptide (TPR) repeat protein
MRFLLLGSLEVHGEHGAVRLGGIKPRAVLAMLLLHANEPVSAERLALALWGEDAPDGAVKTVHVHVWRLRKALGDPGLITTTPAGYCLRVRPDDLDAASFERLLEDGRQALADGRAKRAATLLRQALALWRGPPLADLGGEPFARAEIARLEEQHLAALEARIEADLAAGRHAELVGELRQLVAVHPTREGLAARLMLVLYRSGRQTEALQAYQDARRVLIADAGVEPGPRLCELQQAILRHDATLDPTADVPATAATERSTATVSESCGAVAAAQPVMLRLPRPLHAAAGPAFVGRDAELAWLCERWMQLHDETPSAVIVGGEPGIGKTRLASELARAVHREGALVLYGRCDEGLAVPYQPFVEALRPYARAAGSDRLRAELGDLAPQLGRLLPELTGLGEPNHADPESERFALFEAIAALLEAMTRERHVLLVLDDLHWATNPTLLLLRHLIRSQRRLAALVLCTYRDTELAPDQPLAQLLADLQRDAGTHSLSIGGLDDAAIGTLVQATVGHPLDDRGSQLVRLLQAQTAGNPFFLRELLASLAESRRIPTDADVSPNGTRAQLEAPEGLREVIGHRVARLSAPAGPMLRVAAAAGTTFSFVLLERVLGEERQVLDALDEAVAAGLFVEAEHGDYAFAHALVRQTIYEQLSAARRIRLHRQLGEALETLGSDTDTHIEALAHHFAHAAADGVGVKAATYALAAGRNATARLGHEEAAAHYEHGLQALTLTGQPQEGRRCELLLALGQAHWHAGQLDDARHAYGQAAELADKLGDAAALAHAALGYCGNRPEAVPATTAVVVDLLQRALDAAGDVDSALRARLMGRLAAALAYEDVEHRKPALAREALAMARRVADKAALGDVLASAHRATGTPDSLHESAAMAAELGRVADELGDGRLRMLAGGWLLDHRLDLADIDAVERELEALQQLAHTRKERYFAWLLTTFRANHAHLEGRLDDCETLAHEALAHRYRGRDELAAHVFGMQMLFVRSEQGRLDEVVQTVADFAAQYATTAGWRCALASAYARLGRTAHARHELEALARADFGAIPRDCFWLSSLATLAEVVAALGDTARARLLYELLMPYADRCVITYALLCQGSASRSLGLLATTMSRFDEATQHFEHALEMNARIKAPIWIAHTQHDYARMLVLRDALGDRNKAVELLRAALAPAERLGLKALADKIRSLQLAAYAAASSPGLAKAG